MKHGAPVNDFVSFSVMRIRMSALLGATNKMTCGASEVRPLIVWVFQVEEALHHHFSHLDPNLNQPLTKTNFTNCVSISKLLFTVPEGTL